MTLTALWPDTTIAAASAHPVAYPLALAAHIASAVVGFGELALSGVYGAWGRRLDSRQQLKELRRYFGTPSLAGRCLWAVPITGGIALWLRSGAQGLGQAWAIMAAGCWAATLTLAVTVIWPARQRLQPVLDQLEQSPSLQSAQSGRAAVEQLCRRLAGAAAICDVVFTAALLLMIFQPGG
jgi:hypothetical protein